MPETKFITFDNIIVNVSSIVDVEFPDAMNGEPYHIITNLSSGRSIDTKAPNETVFNARKELFKELLAPADWDARTPAAN